MPLSPRVPTPGSQVPPTVQPVVQEGQPPVVAETQINGSDNSNQTNTNKVIPNCKHFLRARCGHGFMGKNQYNNLAKCRFTHPSPCQNLLKHGFFSATSQLGCKFSKANCKYAHVKMCPSSVRNRECTYRQNCPDGYHIQNTKQVVASNEEEFPALPNTNTYNKTRVTNQQYNEAAQVRSQHLNPRTNYRSV